MSDSSSRRVAAGVSVGVVVLATAFTLGLGFFTKSSCASGDWSNGRQYRQLCYTDVVPLYGTEHLQEGRLPFLDPCPASAGSQCDEYPVLTMYLMRTASAAANSFAGFFYWNVVLLGLLGLATAWFLRTMAGDRALYFALAPTLLIYAFVNWDLLAVALAAAATLAYLRDRDALSGTLLGLGTAAKFYPVLLVIPFFLGRRRQGRAGGATALAVWAALGYLAVNLPFIVTAHSSWATFFRFNSDRQVDWDSLWFVICQRQRGGTSCPWSPHLINALSALLFVAAVALLWYLRRARHPDFPRWTLGFPVLVAFLLANKVYSPQYGLWLLPWFALALPNVWLFVAFELADVAVFITRFSWFGRFSRDLGSAAFAGYSGLPLGAFQIAVVLRAAVLVACLAAWVRQSDRQAAWWEPPSSLSREGLISAEP